MRTIRDQPATTPFHPGERAVQERLGVREQIEPFARRVVRPFLPDEHREFYAQLPFLVVAARDADGRPWATLLTGDPGFVASPTPTMLEIDARPMAGDALEAALHTSSDVGLLGLEFATRRRNRVNGRVASAECCIAVAVDQSFGNCPQYIHPRLWRRAPVDARPWVVRTSELGASAQAWVAAADTFFIASGHRGDEAASYFGMDASHRGGEAGFVEVRDPQTLVFPDYAGNNHFNTIGNLVADPRVGLLFVDFEAGHLLQVTGRASIDWDSPAIASVPGARRLVTIAIDAVVELRNALALRWAVDGHARSSLVVRDKIEESTDVASFVLTARDGGDLPAFEPGQHLSIDLDISGERVSRTYSLSAAPDPGFYRVTIKREEHGLVSRHMHHFVEPGDVIAAGMPAGDFTLKPGSRPVVLVSAGVGVTPMVSMLGAVVRSADPRAVTLIHGARDGAHHPLSDEIDALASRHRRTRVFVAYSRPRGEDRAGVDFDETGRVTAETVARVVETLDADYYLCGPVGFMGEVTAGLIAAGVPAEQIRSETFGPQG